MYRIYSKVLYSDDGGFIFDEKWYVLEEILWVISGSSLKIREVSHVWFYCLNLRGFIYILQHISLWITGIAITLSMYSKVLGCPELL